MSEPDAPVGALLSFGFGVLNRDDSEGPARTAAGRKEMAMLGLVSWYTKVGVADHPPKSMARSMEAFPTLSAATSDFNSQEVPCRITRTSRLLKKSGAFADEG